MNLETLSKKLPDQPSAIERDVYVNVERFLTQGALSEEEALLALAATAKSVEALDLLEFAEAELKSRDFTFDQIREARQSAAIMAMLNTYYRFKHMVAHENPEAETRYAQAGLRMASLAKPALGKARFEMLAFAVSVLNGCENCIRSHEAVLLKEGIDAAKIHDLARLSASVKAWKALFT